MEQAPSLACQASCSNLVPISSVTVTRAIELPECTARSVLTHSLSQYSLECGQRCIDRYCDFKSAKKQSDVSLIFFKKIEEILAYHPKLKCRLETKELGIKCYKVART